MNSARRERRMYRVPLQVWRNQSTHTESQNHVGTVNSEHASTSAAVSHERASPYIALTPQVLEQHDIHQVSSHHDTNVEYIQIDQARRIEDGFNSLKVHLGPTLHTKLCEEPIGMAPAERFHASPSDHQWLSAYQVQARQLDGTVITQTPSQVNPYKGSSIAADAGSDYRMYPQHNSADTIVFAPDQQSYIPDFTYAHVADWGNGLAGIGTQFDSYPYWDHTVSSYINGDASVDD